MRPRSERSEAVLALYRSGARNTKEIARQIGDIAPKTVRQYLRNAGLRAARTTGLWTPELDAMLTALWARRDLSTRTIAEQMNLNKNQIIGRAHRLKLPSRPNPIRQGSSAVRPRPAPKLRRARLAPESAASGPRGVDPSLAGAPPPTAPAAAPAAPGASSIGCMFPMWSDDLPRPPKGKDQRFCGQPRRGKSSWCDEHFDLVLARATLKPVSDLADAS